MKIQRLRVYKEVPVRGMRDLRSTFDTTREKDLDIEYNDGVFKIQYEGNDDIIFIGTENAQFWSTDKEYLTEPWSLAAKKETKTKTTRKKIVNSDVVSF